MKSKAAIIIFLIIGGFITLFSLIPDANKYRAQGLSGIGDCNSPLAIILLNVIAILFIIIAAFITLFLLKNKNNRQACFIFIPIIILLFGINIFWASQAYKESNQSYNLERCGEGL